MHGYTKESCWNPASNTLAPGSAWLLRRVCYCPAVAFPNFCLIVFLLPRAFQNIYYNFFFKFLKIAFLKLRKSGVIAFPQKNWQTR